MVDLDRAESLRLIAGATYGRVVFTRDALPAIRPVCHLVEDGRIILRTRITSRLTGVVRSEVRVVVAYEVDEIDPVTHTGWAVVVTGLAEAITDPVRIARYERLLRPWMDRSLDTVIAIDPSMIEGVRLLESGPL
ncbi:pyridoxamine 5'-phosphate oxidase family protein [Nocardia alni]|uniref:pyridoxamine 5'-phosphate oxidase family protein n=1 Tax=Nocardia alni TaxID=2815723 RepID=UPI0027E06EFA|nr:pyridoxamine 5'-phosphate oxidase family protein [Nocardia alni]